MFNLTILKGKKMHWYKNKIDILLFGSNKGGGGALALQKSWALWGIGWQRVSSGQWGVHFILDLVILEESQQSSIYSLR